MKLTDAQRFELFKVAVAGIVVKPLWPDHTPPARDGSTKKVSKAFAVACHAQAVVRACENVLDDDERAPAASAPADGFPRDEGTPF